MSCNHCIAGNVRYTFIEAHAPSREVDEKCSKSSRSIADLDDAQVKIKLSSTACCRSSNPYWVKSPPLSGICQVFIPKSGSLRRSSDCNSAKRYICQQPLTSATAKKSSNAVISSASVASSKPNMLSRGNTVIRSNNSSPASSNSSLAAASSFPSAVVGGGIAGSLLFILFIITLVIILRRRKNPSCVMFGFKDCFKSESKVRSEESSEEDRQSTLENHGYYSICVSDESSRPSAFSALQGSNPISLDIALFGEHVLDEHEYEQTLPAYEEIPTMSQEFDVDHAVTRANNARSAAKAETSEHYLEYIKQEGEPLMPPGQQQPSEYGIAAQGSGVQYTTIKKYQGSGVEYSTVARCLKDKPADVYAVAKKKSKQ